MRERVNIRCKCCELAQQVVATSGFETPEICSTCYEHRGADEISLRRRAESHLAMVSEHLAAASQYAERMRDERNRYKAKMQAAYGSRETAVRRLRALSRLHEPLGNGVCLCRKRGCESLAILDASWVRDMVAKLDAIEAAREAELRDFDPRDDWSVMAWDSVFGDNPGQARTA